MLDPVDWNQQVVRRLIRFRESVCLTRHSTVEKERVKRVREKGNLFLWVFPFE